MSCPDCFRGHDHPGPTTGVETVLYGLDVYVTEPTDDSEHANKGVVIMFSDAFGWATTNLRQLADSYARRTGCKVYIPDFMYGRSSPKSMRRPDEMIKRLMQNVGYRNSGAGLGQDKYGSID